MEVILKFELPEDKHDYKDAFNGSKYRRVLQDIDNFLRNELKYGDFKGQKLKDYVSIRNELHRIKDEYEVTIWE